MECRWKSCPPPALQIFASEIPSEAVLGNQNPKLANSGNSFLELAKGFEPLTL
jgi:hypothetical protein